MRSLKKKMKTKMKTIKFKGGMQRQSISHLQDSLQDSFLLDKNADTRPNEVPGSPGPIAESQGWPANLLNLADEQVSKLMPQTIGWKPDPDQVLRRTVTAPLEETAPPEESIIGLLIRRPRPQDIETYCETVHEFISMDFDNERPNHREVFISTLQRIIPILLMIEEPNAYVKNAYVKNALAALLIHLVATESAAGPAAAKPAAKGAAKAAAKPAPMSEERDAKVLDPNNYWHSELSRLLPNYGINHESIFHVVGVKADMSPIENYQFLCNQQRVYPVPIFERMLEIYEKEKVIGQIMAIIRVICNERINLGDVNHELHGRDTKTLKEILLKYKKIENLLKNSNLPKIILRIDPDITLQLITHYIQSKSKIQLLQSKLKNREQELFVREQFRHLDQRIVEQEYKLMGAIGQQTGVFTREMKRLSNEIEKCCKEKGEAIEKTNEPTRKSGDKRREGRESAEHVADVLSVNNAPLPERVSKKPSTELKSQHKTHAPGPAPHGASTSFEVLDVTLSGLQIAQIINDISFYLLTNSIKINNGVLQFMEELNKALAKVDTNDNISIRDRVLMHNLQLCLSQRIEIAIQRIRPRGGGEGE